MRVISIGRNSAALQRATVGAPALIIGPVIALAESGSASSPQDAGQAHPGLSRIESVTVTARRREESAQSVPIPIATLSGDALENAGEFRLEDLNRRLL